MSSISERLHNSFMRPRGTRVRASESSPQSSPDRLPSARWKLDGQESRDVLLLDFDHDQCSVHFVIMPAPRARRDQPRRGRQLDEHTNTRNRPPLEYGAGGAPDSYASAVGNSRSGRGREDAYNWGRGVGQCESASHAVEVAADLEQHRHAARVDELHVAQIERDRSARTRVRGQDRSRPLRRWRHRSHRAARAHTGS